LLEKGSSNLHLFAIIKHKMDVVGVKEQPQNGDGALVKTDTDVTDTEFVGDRAGMTSAGMTITLFWLTNSPCKNESLH
jgi:hypothetical protein